MTKFKRKSSKVITGLLLASFLFFPSYKSAQAATTEYKPQTQQEMIAYLLGVLSQLQIQLEQQKGLVLMQ